MTGGAAKPTGQVILAKGRERSVLRFHPWIFSGAVSRVEGDPAPGALVEVLASDGATLGLGHWSPASQIRVRMVAFGESPSFSCRERVAAAIGRRSRILVPGQTDAARLINAESDGLPGVIADFYAGWVVCQFNSAGAAAIGDEVAEAIRDILAPEGVVERSDSSVLRLEGLEPRERQIHGGEAPGRIKIVENGVAFLVDVRRGHKTGFYLDQRDNRLAVREIAAGAEMLNVFSYTGGFGTAALRGGAARVVNIDVSGEALALAKENAALNGFAADDADYVEGNAFEVLRKFRDSRQSFDLIVLDPPKFAGSRGGIHGAMRGYKDINLLAMKLLRPGGRLATFSCSEAMTPELFGRMVAEAAVDAGCDFAVARHLRQAADHPETLFFPEGCYLKGLLLEKRA